MPLVSLLDKKISAQRDTYVDYVEKLGATGDFKKIQGVNVLIKSLRNMFMTPLRTYIFDPNYGSLLYKKVFELADNQTKESIVYEVQDRIRLYDSRVNIKTIDVNYFSDTKGFYISAILEKDGQTAPLDLVFTEYNSNFSIDLEPEQ